jgi:hypothetical protein
MGTLNIISEPQHIDFIDNNPYIEFQLSGYGTNRKSSYAIQYNEPSGLYSTYGILYFEFFGHYLAFETVFNSIDGELPNKIYLPSGVSAISISEQLELEFKRKIMSNYLLSKYFDIDTIVNNAKTNVKLSFTSKEFLDGNPMKIHGTGMFANLQHYTSNGSVTTEPKDWKLWARFVIPKNILSSREQIETPELLFELDADYKIKIPFSLLKGYFEYIDIPDLTEKPATYHVINNSFKVKLQYAEAYGNDIKIQQVKETKEYLIVNGEINQQFYQTLQYDWLTHSGYPWAFAWGGGSWGMNNNAVIRSFVETPQWIYFRGGSNVGTNLILRADFFGNNGAQITKSINITAGSGLLYRIPAGIKSWDDGDLSTIIDNEGIFEYTIRIDTATSTPTTLFKRTYQMIEKPYNARVFLLQNKYGLLESFFIDNLLEQKTIKGNTVVLADNYKIDITNTEIQYTARTGSKRVSEMQLLKQAADKHNNYIVQDDLLIPITILPATYKIAEEKKDLQNAEFKFVVTKSAKSLPGSNMGYTPWNSDSGTSVIGQFPQNGEANLYVDAKLSITFNQNIVLKDVSEVYILDTNNWRVATTVSVEENRLIVSPNKILIHNAKYSLIIGTNAIAGFKPYSSFIVQFTTIGQTQVVSTPQSTENGLITINQPIIVEFDQPIYEIYWPYNRIKMEKAGSSASISISYVSDGYSLIINHENLEPNAIYNVQLLSGSVNDISDFSFSIRTYPELQVVSYKPAFFSTDALIDTEIAITFNQPVQAGILENFTTIRNKTNNVALANIKEEIIDNTLYISHPNLDYNKVYEVIIPVEGLVGLTKNIAWEFTTRASKPEQEILELVSYTPTDDGIEIMNTNFVILIFNKNISALDLSLVHLTDENGQEIAITAAINNEYILIQINDNLQFATRYFVEIPAGTIEGYDTNISFNFRTENFSEVLSLIPENGSEEIEINTPLTVVFDKVISLISAGGITINGSSNNITASVSQKTLTINHALFNGLTDYTVVIPPATIKGYENKIEWKFKTMYVEDTTPDTPDNHLKGYFPLYNDFRNMAEGNILMEPMNPDETTFSTEVNPDGAIYLHQNMLGMIIGTETRNFTIRFSVYPLYNTRQTIFSKSIGYNQLLHYSNEKWYFLYFDSGGSVLETEINLEFIPVHTWSDIIISNKEENYTKVWINGNLIVDGAPTYKENEETIFLFGGDFNSFMQGISFNGYMKEIEYYDEAFEYEVLAANGN